MNGPGTIWTDAIDPVTVIDQEDTQEEEKKGLARTKTGEKRRRTAGQPHRGVDLPRSRIIEPQTGSLGTPKGPPATAAVDHTT